MSRLQLLAACSLAFVAACSQAAQAQEYLVFNYPEADSCSSWSQERASNKPSQAVEGWVLGFVSGRNRYGPGDGLLGAETNSTSLVAWIDRYCAQNPLDTVTKAAMELVKELERRKMEQRPKK
jgi:hypothetical protein